MTGQSGRSSRGGGVASLNAIKVRRNDNLTATTKSGDLTGQLQRPTPAPATIARVPPPIATLPPAPSPPAPSPRATLPARQAEPAPQLEREAPPIVAVQPRIAAVDAATVRVLPVPTAPPAPVYADAQGSRALRSYWEQLRGRSAIPLHASLDPTIVATSWPNTLMVSYSGGMSMPQITRLGRHTGEVEYTTMVTEWILSCSRDAALTRSPVEKEERFPGEHGRSTVRMLLLPFSAPGGLSDHVLCHLTRVE